MSGMLTICGIILLISSLYANAQSTDLEAASAIRDAIGGAAVAAWTGADCCAWPGLVCNPDTLRVTDIVLRGSDSASPSERLDWPDDRSGHISDSLCQLDQLSTLIVTDWNSIFGGIPPCIASLSNLRILDLSGNRLSGDIPTDIGKLRQLVVLNLADNEISGSIPPSVVDLRRIKEEKKSEQAIFFLYTITNYHALSLVPLSILHQDSL